MKDGNFVLNCKFNSIVFEKEKDDFHIVSFRTTHVNDNDYESNPIFTTLYGPLIKRIKDLNEGDEIEVHFSVGGNFNEQTSRWFPTITAFKVYNKEEEL